MLRLFLSVTFSLFLISSVQAGESLSSTEQEEVRKLVRETLLQNPEILVEAMSILQQRQEQARADQQKAALNSVSADMIKGPLTPVAGNPKGDVTLVEFFDYNCGYCKRAFPGVMEVINSDKNIRYVLKEFAILGPESEVAARAALAAEKQGKYMDFHIAMMTMRGRLSTDKIMKTAKDVGLDVEKLKKDMSGDDVNAEITSTREIAQKLGITGTPAFIIGDQVIAGAVPPEALIEAVKQQRKK
ncbi:27kDa outer membrane protein [Candidatus Terasakiella magnetica]|uniref:27kDa outer membrane protein n=2 Tax=Candidatus Terasakiella magnetica TaxID=1867952 RepID=A0A1C3RLA5_9PROT|nr:27kDa outer membrane protein [Candidatus Terasakiella magnetica]